MGLAPRQRPTLSAYRPTLADRLRQVVSDGLTTVGVSRPEANRWGGRLSSILNDLTPVGDIQTAQDAQRSIQRGQYRKGGGEALLAAVGAVPGVGDAAAKVVRKAIPSLGFPSTLNTPRNPTREEMQRAASVQRVPLKQARHGNKLEWDKFGKSDPLVEGYADRPVAVQMENGEFILLDGNHRSALAASNGAEDLEMYVIPARQYDPTNAGRAPVKTRSNVDLDALLAELLGDQQP